jgi:hypothetical protein
MTAPDAEGPDRTSPAEGGRGQVPDGGGSGQVPPADGYDQIRPDGGTGRPVSGLRNPAAAVRGVGAGALGIEALVLLLAIVPMHVLDVRMPGLATGVVAGLAVVCLLLAGALRRRWAWRAATGLQVLLIGCGYFHPVLAVMGVVFAAVWAYVLSVRRSVLGR